MPIYSKNRSGSMALEAANGYSMSDCSRALYESCLNDKAVFDAMINHDINEIESLKEGTILESEIESLNESSFKELMVTLKAKLENLWKKIKRIFQDAIDKIASFIKGDGKKFVAEFKAVAAVHSKSKATVSGQVINGDGDITLKLDNLESAIINPILNGDYDNLERAEIINKSLGKILGMDKSVTPREFRGHIMTTGFRSVEKIGLGDGVVETMCNVVSDGKRSIANLKKREKDCEDYIKQAVAMLKSDKIADAINPALNKKEEKPDGSKLSRLVSVSETVVTIACSEAISYERARISSSRKVLGALMAAVKKDGAKNESAIFSAIVEASYEIDNAFNEDTISVTPEVREYIDSIEAA